MQKLNEILTHHGIKVIIGILLLFFINQCSTNSTITDLKNELENTKQTVEKQSNEIDSLNKELNERIITQNEMVDIINNTPHWELLRIEQLADKKRLPIEEIRMKQIHKKEKE